MIDGSLKPVSTTTGASPPVMRKPKVGTCWRRPGILREDEEARVELDVAQVEDLHLETHLVSSRVGTGAECARGPGRAAIARSDEGPTADPTFERRGPPPRAT